MFLLYGQVKIYQNILELRCLPLGLTLYEAFLKNKKRSGTSLTASYSTWFLKKNISHIIFYELTKFHCLIALLLIILDNMCIVIICLPGCDVYVLKLSLAFLSGRFPTWPKSQDKNLDILRTKRAFNMK